MKTTFRFLIAVVVLVSAFYATACPKKDAIRKAAEASYRLPGLTNDVISKIEEARAKGLLSVDQVRTAGGIISPIAKAEVTFVQLVKSAHEIQKRTGTIPADMLGRIRAMLDGDIIGPFIKLLEFHKLLSPEAAAAIGVALTALRLVLQTIGGGFGSTLLHLIATSPGSTPRDFAFNPKLEFANV